MKHKLGHSKKKMLWNDDKITTFNQFVCIWFMGWLDVITVFQNATHKDTHICFPWHFLAQKSYFGPEGRGMCYCQVRGIRTALAFTIKQRPAKYLIGLGMVYTFHVGSFMGWLGIPVAVSDIQSVRTCILRDLLFVLCDFCVSPYTNVWFIM